MMKTPFGAVLAAAVAFALIAAPASAKSRRDNPENDDLCKPAVATVGDGITAGRARKHAIESWKTKVTSELGADYADADSAKSTSMRCQKLSVAKHSCTLKARPCKAADNKQKHAH
jgi:hypothetical protein